MFSKPTIKKLLGQFTLVKLYTDKVPAKYEPTTSAEENRNLQNDSFGGDLLPFYVILKPTPLENNPYQVLGRRAGKITDVDDFAEFLKENNKKLPGNELATR